MSADNHQALRQGGMWSRLHGALMPDYNRPATAYWWTMLLLGSAAFGWAVREMLVAQDASAWLQLAGGIALAALTALFPLKIPRTNQSFSAGDVFVFLVLLGVGPAAGAIIAALDGLVSSWRSSRRWTTRLGSATIDCVTMTVCGQALHALLAVLPGGAAALVLVAMAFGACYAACNALLMTAVARLKRGERISLTALLDVFGWVGGASAGAAAMAALLFIVQSLAGLWAMLAILPAFALLLTTMHFFSRQQEAEEAARGAAAEALEHKAELATSQARQREAELAAQHLRELENSERRFHSAFTHASIGMALVGAAGRIQLANPALQALLGAEDVLGGQRFGDFISAADQQRFELALQRIAGGRAETAPVEVCCRRRDGCELWVSIACSMFSDSGADEPSLILQIQDVTARRRAEAELQHRAFHDKLTGLPNRDRFHQALEAAILQATSDRDRSFAVMFLDFDRFKLINDSNGHRVGDEFLVQASRRLSHCLRRGDILARLGGDEFAILAAGLTLDEEAIDLGERLLSVLREPLRLSTMEIAASASIGITFSSLGYTRPEDMLRDADIAMYRAKTEGKARYALFDVKLHKEVANRVRLEADLRHALARQATSVSFQPLFALDGMKLQGFEALSRWNHPELGPVSPGTFIPIAEESGLITQLTAFMIEASCRHLRHWQIAHPAYAEMHVHVNAAARDLADAGFVARVRRALAETGLHPRHLVVELTENILMSQLAAAMHTLDALRELGVGLSVDDFGTGYSSLSHLSSLPIDSLKIDMSFVRRLTDGSKEAAVIRAIVLLGTSLGKTIIAEGIETQLQLELLQEMGCHVGQGYYLSRPLLPEAVDALMASLATQPADMVVAATV